MKALTPILLSFLLSACAIPGLPTLANVAPAPAPMAKTTIDDKWLDVAWKSHDALQDSLNLAMDLKPSLIGSPGMKRAADVNDAITAALSAAESAVAAGSTTDYLKAVADAKQAIAEMRTAIAALRGK